MKELKETCYKGTRILIGNEKRDIINKMISILQVEGFVEIQIPIIQFEEMFSDKVGEENNNMMYTFKDRGDRDLCLAPEYTAVVQRLSKTTFKQEKNVLLFYVVECFRGENPQYARFREFTQLGVEIINPTKDNNEYLIELCKKMLHSFSHYTKKWTFDEFESIIEVNNNVTRGLDYYKEGKGFEIKCNSLGSSKQIVGGGEYDGGIGFAIGIDRLISIK